MKIFECPGRIKLVEDADGEAVDPRGRAVPVYAKAYYKVGASNDEAIRIDLYGRNRFELIGTGQTLNQIDLENGVELRGRLAGAGWPKGNEDKITKGGLYDIREDVVQLYPHTAVQPDDFQFDRLILPLAASHPLGIGLCGARGFAAIPGRPFSIRPWPETMRGTWHPQALQFEFDNMLVSVSSTNSYWTKFFDAGVGHKSVAGIRPKGGGRLDWDRVNSLLSLLEAFLGWVNHCSSPIAVLRGYYRRKLVYRGYRIRPNASVPRDRFSWLPWRLNSNADLGLWPDSDIVHDLFRKFAERWEQNRERKDVFHIALQYLRSRERGSFRDKPSTLYFQHCLTACGILLNFVGRDRGKSQNTRGIVECCLQELGVPDVIPVGEENAKWLAENCRQLWCNRQGKLQERELRERTLCRPIANLRDWFVHFDEEHNARRILALPSVVQQEMVQILMWLADLMLLKVVGYNGHYCNRLTGSIDVVPWKRVRPKFEVDERPGDATRLLEAEVSKS